VKPPNQWIVKPFADVGTAEPFFSRLIIGLPQILDATLYRDRDAIRTSIRELAMYSVMPAFLSLRELRKIARDEKIPVLTKTKTFDDMCKSLWTAYKDRMKITAKLMGYDIGFLFQKDPQFEAGCTEFPRTHPEVSHELIMRMKGNRATWQPRLARFRNDYLEHQKIKREDVGMFYSLENAEMSFCNVWVAIEEILVILLAAQLPNMACLREIPEAERNPHIPLRFGFAWAMRPNLP
jgi:hypothetical protein